MSSVTCAVLGSGLCQAGWGFAQNTVIVMKGTSAPPKVSPPQAGATLATLVVTDRVLPATAEQHGRLQGLAPGGSGLCSHMSVGINSAGVAFCPHLALQIVSRGWMMSGLNKYTGEAEFPASFSPS